MSLTTDMWTFKAGDGYISLTAHFVCRNFEMLHRNLETRHLRWDHDHSHLACALRASTSEWCIDLARVSAFTTDNAANIVETVKEDLEITHLPSAGHTLNLAVQSALNVPAISTTLSRCKKVVAHFNQSRVDREELHLKQQQLELPLHSLIQVSVIKCIPRWLTNLLCFKYIVLWSTVYHYPLVFLHRMFRPDGIPHMV